jgi:hypothetical protein
LRPASGSPLQTSVLPQWAIRALKRRSTYLLMGLVILVVDFATGPFLLFPILFVIPVSLAAWYLSTRWACILAVLLPLGRLCISEFIDKPSPLPYIIANSGIRVAVLLILAFFAGRAARQTKQLEEKVSGLVTMCAWSRTIQYQGEWISFEDYLKRRFNVETSHGISPGEVGKALASLERKPGGLQAAPPEPQCDVASNQGMGAGPAGT